MDIRVGTRGSVLARTQTQSVMAMLAEQAPHAAYTLHVVRSLGDASPESPVYQLGAQGVFTQALEQALAGNLIDVAVHSAKDLPSTISSQFTLVAITDREDPRDCIVSRGGLTLERLPRGATIATGSPRRISQLLLLRPDLQFVAIRGNVDTRRTAALRGSVDAVVLAMAGLSRLGLLDEHAAPLEPEECLPQAGQGALAVEILANDSALRDVICLIDSPQARACVEAERAVLAKLAAGCQAPVAAFATVLDGTSLRLRAYVGSGSGPALHADRVGAARSAAMIGYEAASDLLAQGADKILGSGFGRG
jgi:hydroxymethylbilane synthase